MYYLFFCLLFEWVGGYFSFFQGQMYQLLYRMSVIFMFDMVVCAGLAFFFYCWLYSTDILFCFRLFVQFSVQNKHPFLPPAVVLEISQAFRNALQQHTVQGTVVMLMLGCLRAQY